MAEGIARYYNGDRLGPINLTVAPPWGYLTELAKLRDGVTIRVNEKKFVRASAMIDPMNSSEWDLVRARDPRIMKFLQAWAAQTLIPIPSQYLLLAGPPTKSVFGKTGLSSSNPASGVAPGQTPPPIPGTHKPGLLARQRTMMTMTMMMISTIRWLTFLNLARRVTATLRS